MKMKRCRILKWIIFCIAIGVCGTTVRAAADGGGNLDAMVATKAAGEFEDTSRAGERYRYTPEENAADMIGYVMSRDDHGRILVVDPRATNFSDTGGMSEFYRAIWFSDAPKDVQIGDKVRVWHGFVLLSYPGQAAIERLEILPSPRPEGAHFTEAEALRTAIKSASVDTVLVVSSIVYDRPLHTWFIELTDTMRDGRYTFEIGDNQ